METWLLILFLPISDGHIAEYPPLPGFDTRTECIERVPELLERPFSLRLDGDGVLPLRAECRPVTHVEAITLDGHIDALTRIGAP